MGGGFSEQYVREEVFLPLKMVDSWVGLPVEKYAEYGDRIGIMQNTDPSFKPQHNWDTPGDGGAAQARRKWPRGRCARISAILSDAAKRRIAGWRNHHLASNR